VRCTRGGLSVLRGRLQLVQYSTLEQEDAEIKDSANNLVYFDEFLTLAAYFIFPFPWTIELSIRWMLPLDCSRIQVCDAKTLIKIPAESEKGTLSTNN
jgi:hypothetical protein